MISEETLQSLAWLRATSGRPEAVDQIKAEMQTMDGLMGKQEETIGELWEEKQKLEEQLADIRAALDASWWTVFKAWFNKKFPKNHKVME